VTIGWIVLGQGPRLRWGGDIRRHYLLRPLACTVKAKAASSWTAGALRSALDETGNGRPRLASVELLDVEALSIARARTVPTVLDFHDEPIAHAAALGHSMSPTRAAELRSQAESNLAAFKYVIAQSPEFIKLVGLDPKSTLVAPSGTDTSRIVPGPWPEEPVVGLVSGASPGRGIEALVDACRRIAIEVPGLRLWMALAGTTDAGRVYLQQLKESLREEAWVTVDMVPYQELGPRLAASWVLVVPHPSDPYWDAVLPIKMFDYLAAGRPIVATPRAATAALLQRHRAGLITAGDEPEQLAEPIVRLLRDEELARRIGAAARSAAETTYDWAIVGRQLADDVIRREERILWLRRRIRVARNRLAGRRWA